MSRLFFIFPTNTNTETFYNTSIQNTDSAIASEQQIGADTSALEELKGRMESAKSEAAQARPDVETQTKRVETERNMTRAVSTLTNLPAGVQTQADAGAARQALYDYLKADEGGKAAAQSKATEQLKKSISAALEANGLDAGTRQRLEGMLDNIDSKGEMVDNKDNKTKYNRKGKPYPQVYINGYGYIPFPKGPYEINNSIQRNEFTPSFKQRFKEWWISKGKPWPDGDVNIHHIKPLSKGGDNSFEILYRLFSRISISHLQTGGEITHNRRRIKWREFKVSKGL